MADEEKCEDIAVICKKCNKDIDETEGDILYERISPDAPTNFHAKRRRKKDSTEDPNTVPGLDGPYCAKCYKKVTKGKERSTIRA